MSSEDEPFFSAIPEMDRAFGAVRLSEPKAGDCLIPASSLLRLAEGWANEARCTLHGRAGFTPVTIAAMLPSQQAALVAAACELFDLVCAAPGGARTARLCGFEPSTAVRPTPIDPHTAGDPHG